MVKAYLKYLKSLGDFLGEFLIILIFIVIVLILGLPIFLLGFGYYWEAGFFFFIEVFIIFPLIEHWLKI